MSRIYILVITEEKTTLLVKNVLGQKEIVEPNALKLT